MTHHHTTDTQRGADGDLARMLDQRRAMIGNLNHLCLTQTEALLWCDTLIAAAQRRQATMNPDSDIERDIALWDAEDAALDRLAAHLAGASGEERL